MSRKPYASDVSDDEWGFREAVLDFDDRRCEAAGALPARNLQRFVLARANRRRWRMIPSHCAIPSISNPNAVCVSASLKRWCMTCALLRKLIDRPPPRHAAIIDSRTLQSSPESGDRVGYDGVKQVADVLLLYEAFTSSPDGGASPMASLRYGFRCRTLEARARIAGVVWQ